MGGDYAPKATIAGALLALQELAPEHGIQLVGRPETIRAELDAQLVAATPAVRDVAHRLSIVEAAEVIEMTDKPSVAIRGKPNSSMAVGLRLQSEGKSDAFVSAGNTGAQMVASGFILRLHTGLNRPAIATLFPSAREPVVVLDSGANVDCSVEELVQFARLGAVYAEDILGRSNPSVALLSVGEEPEKGNAAVKEAHKVLAQSTGINFIGNVEGRDVPMGECDRGRVDVVVCDGFVGNVLLKFYESIPKLLFGLLARSGVTEAQVAGAFRNFDYAVHGGAPLLGVKGVSIICHGKSSPEAIKNGILVGLRASNSRMSDHIGQRLATTAGEAA